MNEAFKLILIFMSGCLIGSVCTIIGWRAAVKRGMFE